MEKIKKGLDAKIVSLVLAVVFSMHTTAYGIDLSSKSHLRIPLTTNNANNVDRLQKTLAETLMADGESARKQGEYETARNVWETAISIFKEIGETKLAETVQGMLERLEKDKYVSEIQAARDKIGAFGGKKTSFGRNGKALNEVVSRALDTAKSDTVRILDVGASVGPEGYDIAFATAEWLSANRLKGRKKIEIIITDIDPDNIAAAREAVYGEEMFSPDGFMNLDKEKINRRKESFFVREGTSYKVNIDRLREYGIELRYQVLDALDSEGFAQLSQDGKCDLVVCRNVHFDQALGSERTDSILSLQEILSERVWKNVASVLNNTGFAHMGYSITRISMPGLLGEACLKMVTREEMQQEMGDVYSGAWQHFKPKIFRGDFYIAAKLESGLRDIVITSKDENGMPYFSMDFTEFLEDLAGLTTAFGHREPILTSLMLFYLDENISENEKMVFNYWMEFVENKEGGFSSLIIEILIKASGLLTEEGLQRFYNKLIELRVGKFILEDKGTRQMQSAVQSLAIMFGVGKAGIPKWLYEKIKNLDLTPVEKTSARPLDISI